MPKPVCVDCQRFYRPKKNGYIWTEGKPINGDMHALPGTLQPDKWIPYKVWNGDLWECEGCGHQIIVGVPSVPLSQDYYDSFQDWCAKSNLIVNDC
jgi:hypothetical protein